MKQNTMNWKAVTRSYTELNGKQKVKITPIRINNEFIFKVIEVIYLDNQKIYIGFYADRLGKAISKIKNSYFGFQDSASVYNAMGSTEYKLFLLNRIKEDLKRKQYFQGEEQRKAR